jgi:hypothetical protein
MRMTRKIILGIISITILLSCKNSKPDLTAMKQDKQNEQDHISGYIPVNGLKMYY